MIENWATQRIGVGAVWAAEDGGDDGRHVVPTKEPLWVENIFITVDDEDDFTVENPAYGPGGVATAGDILRLIFHNSAGEAMGEVEFGDAYVFRGVPFTAPDDGEEFVATFVYDGDEEKWVERTAMTPRYYPALDADGFTFRVDDADGIFQSIDVTADNGETPYLIHLVSSVGTLGRLLTIEVFNDSGDALSDSMGVEGSVDEVAAPVNVNPGSGVRTRMTFMHNGDKHSLISSMDFGG